MTTCVGLALITFVFLVPVRVACQSLLILPFENRTGDPQLEWLGDAFPELLAERLNSPGRFVITREEWVNAAERMGLASSSHFSRGTMVKLGEELDADQLILGEFEAKHEIIWVAAKVLSFRNLSLGPPMAASGAVDELIGVGTNLAWQVARQMDSAFRESAEEFARRQEAIPLGAVRSFVRSFRSPNTTDQVRLLREALRTAPRYLPAVFNFSLTMFHQKDLGGAIAGFSKIPRDDRRYAEANFYVGLSFLGLNDPAKAQAAFLRAVERAPVAPAFNNVAVAAARLGDGKKAEEYLSRARELDASSGEILFNSGLNAWRGGDIAEAARWLRMVVQENPQDVFARRLLMAAEEKLSPGHDAVGKEPAPSDSVPRAEARTAGTEARGLNQVQQSETAAPTEMEIAAADRIITEWDETMARFVTLEGKPGFSPSDRPAHEELHLRRGQEALARGELESARQELSQALLLDPNSVEAHYHLADVYRRLQRPTEAIRELKAALFGRDSVKARLLLATVYLDEKKWSEAEAEAKNALRLDAENKEAQELLAIAVARSRQQPVPKLREGSEKAP